MKKFTQINETKEPDNSAYRTNINIKPRAFNRIKNNVEGNAPIKDKLPAGPGEDPSAKIAELEAKYNEMGLIAQKDAIKICHWILENKISFDVATSTIGMMFDTYIYSNNKEREEIRKKWIDTYPEYLKKN